MVKGSAENMTPSFSSDLVLAIQAAEAAGKAVTQIYQTDYSFQIKSDNSPVTEADLVSDQIISTTLAKTNYPISSEENEHLTDCSVGKAWIVDPLDGTKDFIAKTGEFTILIGLIENGQAVAGVIYQPTTNLIWVAEKGKGAYKRVQNNWEKIWVREQTELSTAQVTMSRHHLGELEKNILQTLGLSYTSKGSCGYKMAQIASGKFDLYFAFGPKQWDICAGDIILAEAGGSLTQVTGEPIQYGGLDRKIPNGIIAASGVHRQFIDFYKQYGKN